MNQQLREAFQDLARQAGEPRPDGPPAAEELWRRGRRARRGRFAGSALVVGMVLAVLGGLVPLVHRPGTPPTPASYDESRLAVPDHIWAPSSWAPTADEQHPPGPLALVAQAPRRMPWLTTTKDEWYAVSADGQRYQWLDLPHRASEGGDLALSPDGRKLGYFLAGRPGGSPATSDFAGFAVYDTVTGRIRRHSVATRHGLSPSQLVWAPDSRHLVASFGQWTRQEGLSIHERTVAWDVRTGRVRQLDMSGTYSDEMGTGFGGVTAWGDDRPGQVLVVDPATGERRSLRLTDHGDPALTDSHGVPSEVCFNPSGTVAVMNGDLPLGGGSSTTGLHAADVDGRRLVTPRLLGRHWQLNRILGWLDDDRVLAEVHPWMGAGIRYVTYDVRTGSVEPAIGHTDPGGRWLQASFAQDLLRRPLVPGHAPPRTAYPWWPWAMVPGLVLAGLVAAFLPRARRWRLTDQDLLSGDGK